MTRWQDRGEVADSEEDEIDLRIESPGQAPSPQRPVLSQELGSTQNAARKPPEAPDSHVVADHDDGMAGLPAPVAATSGRKGRRGRPNAEARAVYIGSVEARESDKLVPMIPVPPDTTVHETVEPPDEPGAEEHGRVQEDRQPPEPSSSTPPPSMTRLLRAKGDGPAHASDDDGLPDVTQLLLGNRERSRHHSSSRTSSPLSEYSRSPSPGLFGLPAGSQAALARAEQASGSPAHPTAHVDVLEINDTVDAHAARTGRILRARKDIQLHPYLLEKAQYQKQFKEHGLKPVRLIQPDSQPGDEDGHFVHDSSQNIPFSSATAPNDDHTARERSVVERPTYDYFNSSPQSSDDGLAGRHRLLKRRKLIHARSIAGTSLAAAASFVPPVGSSAVPPSPPGTSSKMSSPVSRSRRVFKIAAELKAANGSTPQHLPTPVVSSEARRTVMDESSTSDSPPRTARRFRPVRRDSTTSAVSSSEAESEAEIQAQRLRREQKRIRGVLPASWLKIDLQQQRPRQSASPAVRPRLSTKSPQKVEPPKGVARRLKISRQRSPANGSELAITDGAESDDSVQITDAVPKQAVLELGRRQLSFAPTSTVDDDVMENDFVDAMLAGSSRRTKRRKGEASRQPRITTALGQQRLSRNDCSEEWSAYRKATGIQPRRRNISHPPSRKVRPPQASPMVKLSIVDAPRSPTSTGSTLPQFVRLAMRQSRRAPDRGRHAPSGKLLRLATSHDTAEAYSVLQAWRQGTIAPRIEPGSELTDIDLEPAALRDAPIVAPARVPLAELSDNAMQIPRPTASRKAGPDSRVHTKTGSHKVRRSRLDQAVAPSESPSNETPPGPSPRKPVTRQIDVLKSRRHARQLPKPRNAQLESLQHEFDQEHREQVFERLMRCRTENVALRAGRSRPSEFQVARSRFDDGPQRAAPSIEGPSGGSASHARPHEDHVLPHRPRKTQARRLDIEAKEYRQPSEPSVGTISEIYEHPASVPLSGPVLQGLGAFGTRYSQDFDVRPLEPGLFFQRSTLIGSGDFHDALHLPCNELDRPRGGRMSVRIAGSDREWTVWNEDVAADLLRVTEELSGVLRTIEHPSAPASQEQRRASVDQSTEYLLRSVVRYCSKCMYFADPVDRQHCAESLCRLVDDLAELVIGNRTDIIPKTTNRIRQYMVVVAAQAQQLAAQQTVSWSTKARSLKALKDAASGLSEHAIAGHFDELQNEYERSRISASREQGVAEDAWALSSIVIVHNALQKLDSDATFWLSIHAPFPPDVVREYCVINDFERQWHHLFALLPALDIDSRGRVRCTETHRSQEAWRLPRDMMRRVFELYEASSQVRGFTVNDYVRVLLSRCHRLVDRWRWWQCEPILNTIYDFFAIRSFGFLRNEENRGSPKFLEELCAQPSLDVLPDDRSFHIFLKLLTLAFRHMHQHHVYDARKIGGLSWRFIPSHGRTYQKDLDLKQSDLDALQNHHDLLVSLYHALPSAQRPQASLLRDLVDHDQSHRKACDVNVTAWANLAGFQSSTNEPRDAMQPLCEWFVDMLKATLAQFRLAKTEAERDCEKARRDGASIAEATLQATIANNQRLVAATVTGALAGLRKVLSSASSAPVVRHLVAATAFWTVLDLFDPSQRRLLSAVTEALQVMDTALEVEQQLSSTIGRPNATDDSQEFGDFSGLQDLAADTGGFAPTELAVADTLLVPAGHFLSNIFGADSAPDDSLLQKAVDVWVRTASSLVAKCQRSWISFVDEYSPQSWAQMRNTVQWRKFTPYFMARVIQEPSAREATVRQKALAAWMVSLVEREASLKFQHTLTTALLNTCHDEPLLRNLPFARDRDGRVHMTLADVRQRRLTLLSCLLANIREMVDEAHSARKREAQEIRSSCASLLRLLMQTMKSHYQELQAHPGGAVADGTAPESYVEFVQHVVSFLQQHAGDICKVDPFFTDSNAFPLPARDPTYVVGKLKRYTPKLGEAGSRKQLAFFVQNVSERAAVDGQQQYLADQLCAAMMGLPEAGDAHRPLLLLVLTTSIFPAYLESSVDTACGWILAMPILHACEQVFAGLAYVIALEDDDSVQAAVSAVTAVLHRIHTQCVAAAMRPSVLARPHVMHVLEAMLRVCSSTLPLASHIPRATSHGHVLRQLLRTLHARAGQLGQAVNGAADMDLPDATWIRPSETRWADTEEFVQKQVRDALPNWHLDHDGRYFLHQGSLTKEVPTRLGRGDEERLALAARISSFQDQYEATFAPGRRSTQVARLDACELSGLLI